MPRASFANGFPPDASCLEAPHPSCGTQIMTLIREACGGWAGGQPPGGWTGAPEGGTPPHQIIQRFPTRRLVPGRPSPLVRRRLQHSFAKSAAAGRAGSSPAAVLSTRHLARRSQQQTSRVEPIPRFRSHNLSRVESGPVVVWGRLTCSASSRAGLASPDEPQNCGFHEQSSGLPGRAGARHRPGMRPRGPQFAPPSLRREV